MPAALVGLPMGVGEVVTGGSLVLAVPLAILAGLVSFASPCVLPLVPGYLSYVTGLTGAQLAQRQSRAADAPEAVSPTGSSGVRPTVVVDRDTPDERSPSVSESVEAVPVRAGASSVASRPPPQRGRRQVVLGTAGFIAGFSAIFVSYGALFGGLGAELLAHQDVITRVLGAVVIVMGLGFLGVVPSLQREARLHHRPARGIWGAPVLGALFALGWTPCIGPTLAAVQTLAFTEGSALRGALLSLAYCVGLGLPFLVIGLAMERGLGALASVRRHTRAIQWVGAVSLIVLGVLMVAGLWGSLTVALRGWISGFEVPL